MSKETGKNIFFVIILVIIVLLFGGAGIKLGSQKAGEPIEDKINVLAPEVKNENSDTQEKVKGTETPEVKEETKEAEGKVYVSSDKNWQVNYPIGISLSEDKAERVVFSMANNAKLQVNIGSQINKDYSGYVDIMTETTKIGNESATKITKDSRDHTDGYPSSRIIVYSFSHNQTEYQIYLSYDFVSSENSKNITNLTDEFIESFEFLK